MTTPTWTPWGQPQYCEANIRNDGLVSISTASHGGLYLAPSLWDAFCALMSYRPRHDQFFEEDCEWAAVALAFPALFTDADIYNAVRTAECWLKIPIPETAASIRDRFHAHLVQTGTWERGGCSTAGSADWRVFMRRVADDMARVVLMRDYPSQQFYAAEDVEALPVCD